MNIYRTLETEHTRIRQTLGKLLDTTQTQSWERSDCLAEIRARLLAQKEVEESFIYPLILNMESTRSQARMIHDEQRQILAMVEELTGDSMEETAFQARIERLFTEIFAHLEHQEEKLFDLARRAIPAEQAEDLGMLAEEELRRVRSQHLH